jgi:hypothetical protein
VGLKSGLDGGKPQVSFSHPETWLAENSSKGCRLFGYGGVVVIPNGVAGHDELHLVTTDWAADMFGIHMNVLSERLINEYQK